MFSATAVACSNIAFIKYWGNRDERLRLPANGSISMNLAGLETRTRVTFSPDLPSDRLTINGQEVEGEALRRVSAFLDVVRAWAGREWRAQVESENTFPAGVGIASSASAFAALALAASRALGLDLQERALSRLARRGSGSACRSVPAGFVEWQAGESDEDSFAFSLAPADHWALADCIALVSTKHKEVGSTQGHALAWSSPLQAARVADAPRRLDLCRQAILSRDFEALAQVVELDSDLMHAVMMTSSPPLLYWQPATVAILHQVRAWRKQGWPVCYTIDAGPNVHVICAQEVRTRVQAELRQIQGVQDVLIAWPGEGARVIEDGQKEGGG
ncbi:MAG: diphosphomevalonate decarboxylase [Anaerolineales bacterium]